MGPAGHDDNGMSCHRGDSARSNAPEISSATPLKGWLPQAGPSLLALSLPCYRSTWDGWYPNPQAIQPGSLRELAESPVDVTQLDTFRVLKRERTVRQVTPASAPPELALRFGAFELLPGRRVLLDSGKAVRLGHRALDILIALVARAGQIVSHDELIASAWPDTIVADINIRVHISALRRALGDGHAEARYIVNVVGRGYSFVAAVSSTRSQAGATEASGHSIGRYELPAPLTRMVGRAASLEALIALITEQRFVTVVGTGGIGKSTLALAAGAQLVSGYRNGACFVDLAAITDPVQVPIALATVLGVAVPTEEPMPALLEFLSEKNVLIVLDNCEHVIASVAPIAEMLLRRVPGVSVLATSRERLGAEGEWLHHLSPLGLSPSNTVVTAVSARESPAVQLFIERVMTSIAAFELTDENASAICHICRRLDGVPLALELAAARVSLLGLDQLSTQLDESLLSFTSRRRTSTARHQTLRAAIAWSFDQLSSPEKTLLCRLSAFRAGFTVESAVSLAAQFELDAREVVEGVVSLADKSLLATDISGEVVRHRMLNTTRAYAMERLAETADLALIDSWHADYVRRLLQRAEADWESMSRTPWLAMYAQAIDDVRAALDWAFSPTGNVTVGAEITIAAVPFGYQLALIEELRDRVSYALVRVAALAEAQPLIESRLDTALAALTENLNEADGPQQTHVARARAASEQFGAARDQVAPLLNTVIQGIEVGNYGAALSNAGRLRAVARLTGDPLARLVAERVMAQAQHFYGNHAAARAAAERVLQHPAVSVPLAYSPMPVDRRVSMRIVLARILWLEGFADQAVSLSDECLEYAASDSPFALCQSLALAACPIAFWRGDLSAAATLVERLLKEAARFRLGNWRAYGACYEQAIQAATHGHHRDAVAQVIQTPDGLLRDTLITIGADVREAGRHGGELTDIASWCAPELLRVQGEKMCRHRSPDARARAEPLFWKSLELARAQNALAWQLRAATSLAKLRPEPFSQTAQLLESVCDQFTEGQQTTDLKRARTLLLELAKS